MQIVTANRAIGEIRNGCTKPYNVLCGGETFVVKFMQNPEGVRVLANEFICSKLAEMLQLPIPTPAIIEVRQTFIEDHGNEVANHVGESITAGNHFGTKRLKKAYQVTSAEMLHMAKNIHVVPEILLFDHWIHNSDRDRNGGNLLFDAVRMEVVIIDHTHAFDLGPLWNATQLKQRLNDQFSIFDTSGYVYKKLVPYIRGNRPFHSILDKMSRLTRDDLWNIIKSVPEEWNVSEEDKIALHSYLWNRLNRIEQVLPLLKPVLPYWKGGT
ncbi:HipA family kinase [Effusibacillus consociatus]|uniref:HipA family kinase n=1 Tax=Effusibacillus consociatus TaxID=1117041 RepID=A0ABV9Q455_9BACL